MDRAIRRLEAIKAALQSRGQHFKHRIYPACLLGYTRRPFLRGMWHLQCSPSGEGGAHLVVEHEPEEDMFLAAWVRAVPSADSFDGVLPNPAMEELCEQRVLYYERLLQKSQSAEVIADVVRAAIE